MGKIAELAPRTRARMRLAPSKRWRNRWRHTKEVVFSDGFRAGPSVHLGSQVFPSREIAEERAAEWMRDHPQVVVLCGVIYLGAVPERE